MSFVTLDKWRDYFRTANSDIFDIIEHAIMVAVSDCPQEFRLRRDRIAEKLFACKLTKCSGCDRVELAEPCDDKDEGCKSGLNRDGCEFEAGRNKESKVDSTIDDHDQDHGEMNMNQVSNYSFGEAEALTDQIEEESQIVGEVLRIKEIFDNNQDESDQILFDSLRRLQLMALSVETLKATEIGKAVNVLQKHGSKQIRHLARTLIEGWKVMVDEWLDATAAVAEGTPESLNPSTVDEEEGLPFPPLDEAVFFATQTTSIELSQFFDGMDDDGNPRNSGEFNKNHEYGRKPSRENQNIAKHNPQFSHEVPPKDKKCEQDKKSAQIKKQEAVMKNQATVMKPNKSASAASRPGRPTKLSVEERFNDETKLLKKSDQVTIQKRMSDSQQDKSRCSDERDVKLEAAKRKLHQSYQQVANGLSTYLLLV
ncbi:unnamed protein product [Ilex paraguariensis]|uniref:TFIIS N-terminal domain-containing protein n=1 Tax=Ilex paraguariensis TaxID=185542 RepID=A0ABC8TGD5_9AQUA